MWLLLLVRLLLRDLKQAPIRVGRERRPRVGDKLRVRITISWEALWKDRTMGVCHWNSEEAIGLEEIKSLFNGLSLRIPMLWPFTRLQGPSKKDQKKTKEEKTCKERLYKIYHEMEKKKGQMNSEGSINMSEKYKRKNPSQRYRLGRKSLPI